MLSRIALTSPTARRLFASSTKAAASSRDITRIDPNTLPTMSQAVVHKDIVYLSGQVDGTAPDLEGQMKNVLAKIDSLLENAGTDKSRLITSNIWLKDIGNDFGKMNEIWNAWVDPENKPVRATVESNLAFPNMLVEVQVTAAKK
uniref:Uncharacterized protein n=1 Tax=Odontella aurita TaxID=265563 RepID=A0A7S4MKQ3_9STRA|mmetsp:Transcript_24370/g.71549  ORF Transcript_24370/g.71549 Transcript_24370/m.71549 type:complete len:145 (+) Transcript_24370:82-516(+)